MKTLVVFTGLLGAGKSRQATHLAQKRNWRLLQIDKLRKAMIPCPEYNDEEMHTMYKVMLAVAEAWLQLGFDVILDATFSTKAYHMLLKEFVARTKVRLKVIHCTCSEETAVKRLKKRMQRGNLDAADTTPERYFVHKRKFQLLDFCPVKDLDTERSKKATFKELEKYIDEK